MLLLQRAGLAPASTPHSVPSGDFNVAENAEEVKQNLLKQEFSGKYTSINSTKAPAVFAAEEDKLGGNKKRGGRRWFHFPPVSDSRSLTLSPHRYCNTFRTLYQAK